jgi:hypothetical protein
MKYTVDEDLKSICDEIAALKEGREIIYGYLGVTVSTPTPRERRTAGASRSSSTGCSSTSR